MGREEQNFYKSVWGKKIEVGKTIWWEKVKVILEQSHELPESHCDKTGIPWTISWRMDAGLLTAVHKSYHQMAMAAS